MKVKISIIILTFSIMLITSCNMHEGSFDEMSITKENVANTSSQGFESDSIVLEFVKNNPTSYTFNNPNSHLWQEESDYKSQMKKISASQPPINAIGYEIKTLMYTEVTMFPKGLACDTRIQRYVQYVYKKYQYKKIIQIPAGADLILPPLSVMSTIAPMGNLPGTTNSIGYSSLFVSTNGVYDTYYLITESREITHTAAGQQVAPLDNPIYMPCTINPPSQLLFKYQYSDIDWG